MTLHVHNRKQITDPVSPEVVDALRAAYFTTRQPSASQRDAAQGFLKDLRRSRRWLACDCPGERQAPALMAPREPEHAEIHLFQFGRVQHAAGCPFARTVERRPSGSQHDPAHLDGPLDPPWTIRPFLDAGTVLNTRLDQILRAALTRSGLGRINAADLDSGKYPGRYLRLDGKPSALMSDALGEVEIDDHQLYGQAGLQHLRSIAKFSRTPTVRSLARTAGGYVGLAIGLVDEVIPPEPGKPPGIGVRGPDGDLFVVYVERPITGAGVGSSGPYWAALALCQRPTDRALRAVTASVLPALDRLTGIPLMRDEHREAARLLLDQAVFWKRWKSTQCNVAIDFPIYQGVSADAVIATPSGRMVETYFDADEPTVHGAGTWGDAPEPVYFKGKAQRQRQLQLSAAVVKALNLNAS